MVGISLRSFGLGLAITMAPVTSGESAGALTYDDIVGSWCGSQSNPNWTNQVITRTKLTIVAMPQKQEKAFKIAKFKFTDTTVDFTYFAADAKSGEGTPGNDPLDAEYGNFSADGKTMDEITGNGTYHFTRC